MAAIPLFICRLMNLQFQFVGALFAGWFNENLTDNPSLYIDFLYGAGGQILQTGLKSPELASIKRQSPNFRVSPPFSDCQTPAGAYDTPINMVMPDKAYIIFCDESEVRGKFYSNFYGGVMVGSSQYDRITNHLNAEKQRLNLFGEIKWSKVTAKYLSKYESIIRTFFQELRAKHVRLRIMFRQNAHVPVRLTQDQLEGAYFRLYYQFIKHAFGLPYRPHTGRTAALKLYFDEFPDTQEAATQFKGFILGLKDNPKIRQAGWTIAPEDIAEIRSHDHVLAQCLDIVLGAMAFRLNDKHKEIPPGETRRGKRTIAKEALYKTILAEIRHLKPGFNIGISTGTADFASRWNAPYLHWRFVPSEFDFQKNMTKKGRKNGPAQPT